MADERWQQLLDRAQAHYASGDDTAADATFEEALRVAADAHDLEGVQIVDDERAAAPQFRAADEALAAVSQDRTQEAAERAAYLVTALRNPAYLFRGATYRQLDLLTAQVANVKETIAEIIDLLGKAKGREHDSGAGAALPLWNSALALARNCQPPLAHADIEAEIARLQAACIAEPDLPEIEQPLIPPEPPPEPFDAQEGERRKNIANLRAQIERELARRTYQGYQDAVNLLRQLLALNPPNRLDVEAQLKQVEAQFNDFAIQYGELRTAQTLRNLEKQILAIQRMIDGGIFVGREGEDLPGQIAELTLALRQRLNESARRRLAVAQTVLAQAQNLFDEASADLAVRHCQDVLDQPNVGELDAALREEIETFRLQAGAYKSKITIVNRLLTQARTAQRSAQYDDAEKLFTQAQDQARLSPNTLPTETVDKELDQLNIARHRSRLNTAYQDLERLYSAGEYAAAERRLEEARSQIGGAPDLYLDTWQQRITAQRNRVALRQMREYSDQASQAQLDGDLERAREYYQRAANVDSDDRDEGARKERQSLREATTAITSEMLRCKQLLDQAENLLEGRPATAARDSVAPNEMHTIFRAVVAGLDEALRLVRSVLHIWRTNRRAKEIEQAILAERPNAYYHDAEKVYREVSELYNKRAGVSTTLLTRLTRDAQPPIERAEQLLTELEQSTATQAARKPYSERRQQARLLRAEIEDLRALLKKEVARRQQAAEQVAQAETRIQQAQGDPGAALSLYRQANDLYHEVYDLDPDHPGLVEATNGLRTVYRQALVAEIERLLKDDTATRAEVARRLNEYGQLAPDASDLTHLQHRFDQQQAWREAQVARQAGDTAGALAKLEAADPNSSRVQDALAAVRLIEGERYLRADNPVEAVRLLTRVVQPRARVLERSAQVLLAIRAARMAAYAGDFRAAATAVTDARSALPAQHDDPTEYTLRRQDILALETWLAGVEPQWLEANTLLRRAQVSAAQGNDAEMLNALESATKALALLDPKFTLYQEIKTTLEQWQQEHQQSISAQITQWLAEADQQQAANNLFAALDRYHRVLSIDPQNVEATSRLPALRARVDQYTADLSRQATDLLHSQAATEEQATRLYAKIDSSLPYQPDDHELRDHAAALARMRDTLSTVEGLLKRATSHAARFEIDQATRWYEAALDELSRQQATYSLSLLDETHPGALKPSIAAQQQRRAEVEQQYRTLKSVLTDWKPGAVADDPALGSIEEQMQAVQQANPTYIDHWRDTLRRLLLSACAAETTSLRTASVDGEDRIYADHAARFNHLVNLLAQEVR